MLDAILDTPHAEIVAYLADEPGLFVPDSPRLRCPVCGEVKPPDRRGITSASPCSPACHAMRRRKNRRNLIARILRATEARP